jgi:hypothetical protein
MFDGGKRREGDLLSKSPSLPFITATITCHPER